MTNKQLHLAVGRLTDRGKIRERNEDFVGGPEGIPPEKLEQKGRLYVVADGMGGHLGGQRAAQLAVERVIQEYYRDPSLDIPRSLERAIKLANAQIYSEAARNPAYKGMGSTIVAAVVRGDDLYVANVGDSRAYLIRGSSIQQITRDHSWIAEALRAGTITPEQALTHPNRGVVTRSLGGGPDVQVDHFHRKIRPGDVVLLCSDGLTSVVSDADIQKVVTRERPQRAANKLISMANQAGGPDNIAAIVIGVQRAPGAAPAAVRPHGRRPSLAPLLGGVAALALVLGAMFVLGPPSRVRGTPTPLPPAPTELPRGEAGVTDTPTPTSTPPSPTSTLAPTSTPTATPVPPTPTPVPPTPTPTPVPPTPKATPPTPTPVPPTHTPTPPPPTETPTPVPPTATPTTVRSSSTATATGTLTPTEESSLVITPTKSDSVLCLVPATRASSPMFSWEQGSGLEGITVYALASASKSSFVYAGTWGKGVYTSTISSGIWSQAENELKDKEVSALAIDPISPSIVYAGVQAGGVYRSLDSGTSWTKTNGLEGKDVWSLIVTSTVAYAGVGSGGVYTSTNGIDWAATGGDLVTTTVYALAVDPTAPYIAYAGTSGRGVYKTTNGGSEWTQVGGELATMTVYALAINPNAPAIIYAGTSGHGVYKSVNGGDSWSQSGLEGIDVNSVVINPLNPQLVYAGTWGGGVYMSMDGGNTWGEMHGLTGGARYVYALTLVTPKSGDYQILYAGTIDGVWEYTITSIQVYTTYLPIILKGYPEQ